MHSDMSHVTQLAQSSTCCALQPSGCCASGRPRREAGFEETVHLRTQPKSYCDDSSLSSEALHKG